MVHDSLSRFRLLAHLAAKQKAAVEWVKSKRRECYYDFEVDEDGLPLNGTHQSALPENCRSHLLGDDYECGLCSNAFQRLEGRATGGVEAP